MSRASWMIGVGLVLWLQPARADQAGTLLAAVAGLEQPCAADGICNIAVCDRDPDCPPLPTAPPSSPIPRERVTTSCGGELWVEATDSPVAVAAGGVRTRYATLNIAQKAKDPSYFDAHPSGVAATGHGELAGFGVTMVQGKRSEPVDNASGRMDDPTLLFFEKDGNDQDDWQIIGMGYSFMLERDGENRPISMPSIPASEWLIHEAGYHHSPGNGGFTCATNDDLKKSAFEAGKRIDSAGCKGIVQSDLRTREFHADKKHGRYWAVHVWFDPSTRRPAFAKTDPWCRQSSQALNVAACAFFSRGDCP